MEIRPGRFLQSLDNDPPFKNALILLTEYNQQGAMGFVINRVFPRVLNELVEFSFSKPFPLFDGGPVASEELFFIHRRPDLIQNGVSFTTSLYLGGDFKKAAHLIANDTLTKKDLKIFIGYCGWDAGQLETEIGEGAWMVAEMEEEVLFDTE